MMVDWFVQALILLAYLAPVILVWWEYRSMRGAKRRRFQFGIRSLLALTTWLAVVLAAMQSFGWTADVFVISGATIALAVAGIWLVVWMIADVFPSKLSLRRRAGNEKIDAVEIDAPRDMPSDATEPLRVRLPALHRHRWGHYGLWK